MGLLSSRLLSRLVGLCCRSNTDPTGYSDRSRLCRATSGSMWLRKRSQAGVVCAENARTEFS